jgi:hypothetical protein
VRFIWYEYIRHRVLVEAIAERRPTRYLYGLIRVGPAPCGYVSVWDLELIECLSGLSKKVATVDSEGDAFVFSDYALGYI